MKVLAIDPGPVESGWMFGDPLDRTRPMLSWGKSRNEEIRERIIAGEFNGCAEVCIERFVPYGRSVGEDSIQTVLWTGRLQEIVLMHYGSLPVMIRRREVSKWICDVPSARDDAVRQALVDRYGPGRDIAIGVKARPGPLYGVKRDVWLALALAVTYAEHISGQQNERRAP